jgi:uncharacterized membrane protein YeaQ/YmgE (transglycosylase-associated protein family)
MKGASMFGFIWWLMIGLVAGGLARLLVPGQQAMGLFLTMILGLVGSVVGGLISTVVYGYSPTDPGFHTSGLIMSTFGAVIALGVYVAFARRNAT